jgi:hypothetical protein
MEHRFVRPGLRWTIAGSRVGRFVTDRHRSSSAADTDADTPAPSGNRATMGVPMSARDALLLVQPIVLAATNLPALRAVKTASETSRRERLAARIRDDEHRADRIAEQIVRLSHTAADASQGRVPIDAVHAEQYRLKVLLTPLSPIRLKVVEEKFVEGDPTHASKDDVLAALAEVGTLSTTYRKVWDSEVFQPEPSRRWWARLLPKA